MVVAVNKDNFKQEVIEEKGVVVVDFYADWCGPCRMTAPIVDELSQQLTGIKFVKVNVDENPDLASQYQIFSIPTFLIFKNGEVISSLVGVQSKESFLNELKKFTD
jgi:thioredoxin 1